MKHYTTPSCELFTLLPTEILTTSGEEQQSVLLNGGLDDDSGILSVTW